MPRTNRPPAYRHQKARDCAVVTIHGKNHYLGRYASPESHERYGRLIAQWQANGGQPSASELPTSLAEISVNEVILRFLEYASGYYLKNGQPTGELSNISYALKIVE